MENGIQLLQEELDAKQDLLIVNLQKISTLQTQISVYHVTLEQIGGFKNLETLIQKKDLQIRHLKANINYLTETLHTKSEVIGMLKLFNT